MKVKIDQADKVFSQYIRMRDRRCLRCGSYVQFNGAGMPVTHQCSHYWSRGKENTRFDPENCDTLCYGCHQLWGHGDQRDGYKEFKIRQLGEEGFKRLDQRAHSNGKKDRKLQLLIWKEALKKLSTEQGY